MDRLGHSSIQITMNTYGHLFPSEDEATINGSEQIFHEASASPSRPVRGLTVLPRTARDSRKRKEPLPEQGFLVVAGARFELATFGL